MGLTPHISATDLQASPAQSQLPHDGWWIPEDSYSKGRETKGRSTWVSRYTASSISLRQWMELTLTQQWTLTKLWSNWMGDWRSPAKSLPHCDCQTFSLTGLSTSLSIDCRSLSISAKLLGIATCKFLSWQFYVVGSKIFTQILSTQRCLLGTCKKKKNFISYTVSFCFALYYVSARHSPFSGIFPGLLTIELQWNSMRTKTLSVWVGPVLVPSGSYWANYPLSE